MKHILLTTIAAVVLAGCGPSEAERALVSAAGVGDLEAVNQHLADGTDVNQKPCQGYTPLMAAGTKEIAEFIISKSIRHSIAIDRVSLYKMRAWDVRNRES